MALRSRVSCKYILALASLGALFFAPAALANNSCAATTTCIGNRDGNVSTAGGTGVGSTFSLSGSELMYVGWKADTKGLNGFLNFKTGAMMSGGSYATGAFFSATGSSFVVKGNYNGVNGTLFQGTFTPGTQITWSLIGPCVTGQSCTYDLSGQISGTWYPNSGAGVNVTGATVQLYFITTGPYHGGSAGITDQGGVSYVNTPTVTAEPASLALMGTGLFGVGFLARRKAKRLLSE